MLTAVVLTKNAGSTLNACLDSLAFCDHIIVLDDHSQDNTVAIAKNRSAQILTHSLGSDFSSARNFALSQVASGWVLFVDADEQVTPELARQIQLAVAHPTLNGFLLSRQDDMWGIILRHGDTGNSRLVRLAQVGTGRWHGRVHETWEVAPPLGSLSTPLIHTPHPTLADFLSKINSYSSIKAQEFADQGRKSNLFEITLGPLWRFFEAYILKMGFLDGTAGFIHAGVMALYMFLVAAKLYLHAW